MPLTSIIATTSQKVPFILTCPKPVSSLVHCPWVDFVEILTGAVTVHLNSLSAFVLCLTSHPSSGTWFTRSPMKLPGFLSHIYPAPCLYVLTTLNIFQHPDVLGSLPSSSEHSFFPLLRVRLSFSITFPTLKRHVYQLSPSAGITFSRIPSRGSPYPVTNP